MKNSVSRRSFVAGAAIPAGSALALARCTRRPPPRARRRPPRRVLLSQPDRPSLLREAEELSSRTVFQCAARGDKLAQELLDRVYDLLGLTIAGGCCMVDPELVVLGGGMSKAGQTLLDGVEPRFQHHMFHACKGTKFALATLGNDAGIYGCFHLALQAK